MAWLGYALVSAGAAALTAILAKIGIDGVPSTLATAIRTVVVTAFAWAMVFGLGQQHAVPGVFPRAADGAGITGRPDRQTQFAAHYPARRSLAARARQLAGCRGRRLDGGWRADDADLRVPAPRSVFRWRQ